MKSSIPSKYPAPENQPGSSNLTEADYELLARSYITPELAQRAGIFRVDSVTGAEMVGRTPKASVDYSGLIFPYTWPGETRPRECRLRRDTPDLERGSDGKTREKNKYLSPPGRANLLYFPPGTDPKILRDTSIPAVITEGEKKDLALARFHGDRGEVRLLIGLSGVWNWRGVIGKEVNGEGKRQDVKGVISDLDRIEWRDREVEIVFDVNVRSKPEVAAARRELAKELINRGAIVRMVDLPDDVESVNGVDDLLYIKGTEFVADWFEKERLKAIKRQVKTMAGNIVFTVDEKGVYARDVESGDSTWVCSPLYVEADTRDTNGDNWGRLLRFVDGDGREHKWAMPMELLSGDGKLYREKLLNSGLIISPVSKARNLLEFYLSTKPQRKVRCVSKIGWHGRTFVLPDASIGADDNEEIYLQAQETNQLLRTSGTLEEWRDCVSHYCVGNSRLVFAVSIGFAAAMLNLIGEESGGVHYRGETTEGKTTALYVAGSVWGGGSDKGFLKRWKTTGNGLENVSACHNDSLLCLDEIAECDPREVGAIAYMLGNGQGKIRSHRGYATRPVIEWRLLFLSSGEIRLSDLMAQNGQRIKGGQEVRFVNIESNAGTGYGLFEELHGFKGGGAFSKYLVECSKRYYGTAIRSFIKSLVDGQALIKREARNFLKNFAASNVPKDAGSEVGRVANRFGLAAYAGEYATAQGITGWAEGAASAAAAQLFREWIDDRGTIGSSEAELAIKQVRAFLEAHGASRFQTRDDQIVNNRVGFKVTNREGQTEYLIQKEQFANEICKGFDPEFVARTLHSQGHLTRRAAQTKGFTTARTVPDKGRVHVYVLNSKIFGAEDGTNESDE